MKRALVLSLMCVLGLAVAALAGPSLNPWAEINIPAIAGGVVPDPTLDAGITIEGMLSPDWFIDAGFNYADGNILIKNSAIDLGFESNIGFDKLATVNTTESLVYGCEFTIACDVTYTENYPNNLVMATFIPSFIASGYVGPFEMWAGINIPWQTTNKWLLRPLFGMRLDFTIDL